VRWINLDGWSVVHDVFHSVNVQHKIQFEEVKNGFFHEKLNVPYTTYID